MRKQESKLQQACVRWFKYQYAEYAMLLFAIPNGGSRNIREAANLKKEGVLKGVSDLFLSLPNSEHNGLYIEMKLPKTYPTKEQRTFMANVKEVGFEAVVCRTFEEFESTVNEYIKKHIATRAS